MKSRNEDEGENSSLEITYVYGKRSGKLPCRESKETEKIIFDE
jgi:hypothetical protein